MVIIECHGSRHASALNRVRVRDSRAMFAPVPDMPVPSSFVCSLSYRRRVGGRQGPGPPAIPGPGPRVPGASGPRRGLAHWASGARLLPVTVQVNLLASG